MLDAIIERLGDATAEADEADEPSRPPLVAAVKLAITGGTGFVGSHLIDAALAAGHEVGALTRRDQPPRDGVDLDRRRPRRPRRAEAAGRRRRRGDPRRRA